MHEHTAGRATLAVLGAGPKGLAVAAKRAALARAGRDMPDLLVVEREGVAANWSGAAGYTDGRQLLSTEPEKDVGFPYAHGWGAASEPGQPPRWAAGPGRATSATKEPYAASETALGTGGPSGAVTGCGWVRVTLPGHDR